MKNIIPKILLAIIISFFWSIVSATSTDSISQYGITWYFDQEYECGQFINGDYWVVGPVTIIRITPESTVDADYRFINGSMVNPLPDESQGYDKAMYANYGPDYDSTKNVARPNGLVLSETNPLVLQPGSSLVSTISLLEINRPQLSDAAILTVLDTEPPTNSFRPPYSGSYKPILSVNDIQWELIPSLSSASVTNIPSITDLEGRIERPWIDHHKSWLGRYMHPSNNMPDYGREICLLMGETALLLALDYSNEEKDTLLYHFIQKGIDFYGIANAGGLWPDLGGHMVGRKFPILFAGLILNNADILAYADASQHFIFQEDRQTWYVTQDDVGRSLYHDDGRPRVEYVQEDVGLPEWGEQHTRNPARDGRNWDTYYRDNVAGGVVGEVLAAHIFGAKDLWNWPAVFDYMDRWSLYADTADGVRVSHSRFITSMWGNFRADYPPVWPQSTTSSAPIEKPDSKNEFQIVLDQNTNILCVNKPRVMDETFTVDIFSISGKKYFSKVFKNSAETIDLDNFNPGIYIVRVSNNNSSSAKKIILF